MDRYSRNLGKAAACAAILACAGGAAEASTVTFDWVSTGAPATAATGSVSLTSSLITSNTSFAGTQSQLTAAGETAVGDISAFSLTFATGETLSLANSTFSNNSTGWSDDSTGHLTSTWTISRTDSSGTLQVASVPYAGTSVAQSVLTSGTTQDFGYWKLDTTPVPVPAAVWLFGSGLAGLIAARRRRPSPAAALATA